MIKRLYLYVIFFSPEIKEIVSLSCEFLLQNENAALKEQLKRNAEVNSNAEKMIKVFSCLLYCFFVKLLPFTLLFRIYK